jgi:hypothetical protein
MNAASCYKNLFRERGSEVLEEQFLENKRPNLEVKNSNTHIIFLLLYFNVVSEVMDYHSSNFLGNFVANLTRNNYYCAGTNFQNEYLLKFLFILLRK